MADELPRAFRYAAQHRRKCGGIEAPGSEHAEAAVGGRESTFVNLAEKISTKPPERSNLQGAQSEGVSRRCGAPRGLEGIADRSNAASLGGPQNRIEYGREHVSVLVRVDVGDGQAGLLQADDLGDGFPLDMRALNAAEGEIADETGERGSKNGVACRGLFAIEQGSDGCRVGNGRAIEQYNVAAHAERWMLFGRSYSFGEAGSGRHQRRRSQCAMLVQFDNCAMDAARQSEVIGIYNQAAHSMSLPRRSHGLGRMACQARLTRQPQIP